MSSIVEGRSGSSIERISIGSDRGLEEAAEHAAETLRMGGIVVHPTETVYGLGGDCSESSNRSIADIKGREPDRPLLVLTPDTETLSRRFPGVRWPAMATELAARFWPGPLTLVLPCGSAPAGLLSRDGGLAVRVSPDPVVKAILKRWGAPMTSTSANRSGAEPARDAGQALAVLSGDAAARAGLERVLVVDGGPRRGRPSTVVSLLGAKVQLLREGPIGRAELRDWLHDS